MSLFEKAQPIGKRQKIAFKCNSCGACCKNVRDSIVLEPLDAFRIIRVRMKNGSRRYSLEYGRPEGTVPWLLCVRFENGKRQRRMRYAQRQPMYDLFGTTENLSPVSVHSRPLPGRTPYQVAALYGATAPFWQRHCHRKRMAKKECNERRRGISVRRVQSAPGARGDYKGCAGR